MALAFVTSLSEPLQLLFSSFQFAYHFKLPFHFLLLTFFFFKFYASSLVSPLPLWNLSLSFFFSSASFLSHPFVSCILVQNKKLWQWSLNGESRSQKSRRDIHFAFIFICIHCFPLFGFCSLQEPITPVSSLLLSLFLWAKFKNIKNIANSKSSNWYFSLFSSSLCLTSYWYREEKFCPGHSWELKLLI